MRLAFWEWMIRGDDRPPPDGTSVLGEYGIIVRRGILKSSYGPYRARDLFRVPVDRDDGPIWTFDRMGATRTELADGRLVCVGGEHEESYDPDFCIYNDVVVLGHGDRVEIYGYPRTVFPPTDFHTASLVGDHVIIVGCLGYPDDRRPGHTPVYALDLGTYYMSEVRTTGDQPGRVHKHEAEVGADGVITVRAGEVLVEQDGESRHRRNVEEFALDTQSWVWRRLTDRNWPQFAVRQADRKLFVLERDPEPEQVFPREVEHARLPCSEWNRIRFAVGGVAVSVTVAVAAIEVIVEGDLPPEVAGRIAEGVRASAESTIGRLCVLEPV
jgi:hypothetical protein